MKKLILTTALLLTLGFTLTSCGEDTTTDTITPDVTTPDVTPEPAPTVVTRTTLVDYYNTNTFDANYVQWNNGTLVILEDAATTDILATITDILGFADTTLDLETTTTTDLYTLYYTARQGGNFYMIYLTPAPSFDLDAKTDYDMSLTLEENYHAGNVFSEDAMTSLDTYADNLEFTDTTMSVTCKSEMNNDNSSIVFDYLYNEKDIIFEIVMDYSDTMEKDGYDLYYKTYTLTLKDKFIPGARN